ncbi:MAG: type 4a pilus biogenesis protein PilO [Thermoleophilia bacterium]|nr:type 4a pilus biogenesis protein PilO [Thermoleophilia bacterium]MDH5333825.1 type 4a pilus biogenesis protein PilO [Thermoleophilia bacterium]
MTSVLRTQRGMLAAGAAALALVLVAGWFLVVSPKRSRADELVGQVAAAQTELAQKRAELARPSANVRIRANDLFRLSKALPGAMDTASVILDVDRLARQHELSFFSLTPESPQGGAGFVQQPYGVVLEGRFGDVSRFLRDLRTLVKVKKGRLDARGRVYAVDRIELKEPETDKKFPVVKASLTVNAYSYAGDAVPPGNTPETTTTSTTGTVAAGATP